MSQVSAVSLTFPPIAYQGTPVLTTDMLAHAYEVEPKQIRQNYANNKERFVEGKHFFSVSGQELKTFLLCVENFDSQISSKVRVLTLWTERGAARHAKMLNSDKAWDVFELLEETFFRVAVTEPVENTKMDKFRNLSISEFTSPDAPLTVTPSSVADRTAEPVSNPEQLASPLSRRTDPERKALTAIINTWVGMAPIHYATARVQVNSHFGVSSVDELTVKQVKEAIKWVQGKIDALPPAPEQLALSAPATPSAPVHHHPSPAHPTLSAELERYASEFETLAPGVEDLKRLMVSIRRLSVPLTSEAARTLCRSSGTRGFLETALEEHLHRARVLAEELVPCARLGINVMRELARSQGR